MTGAAEAPSEFKSTRHLVARVLRDYVRPYRAWLALAVLCMTAMAAATAGNAWLMEPILDDVFLSKDTSMLYWVVAMVLALAAVKGVSNFGQAFLMNRLGLRILADMQSQLFGHLMRADLAFFHKIGTGKLISRFTNDINLMRGAVSTALTGVAKDALTVVFLVALMFYQDWSLALIAFMVFPIAFLPVVKLGRRMRRVSARTQEQFGVLTARLDETFQSARHVKAYRAEDFEIGRAGGLIEGLYSLGVSAAKVRALSHPIMESLGGVAIAAVIFYGGSRVMAGSATPGSFFSFITALLMAYQPLKSIANLNTTLQEGLAAAQRLFDLLDVEPEIVDADDARPLVVSRGEIRFEKVTFAYDDHRAAIHEVTLKIAAGETTALVGPSGGGKSTILNLIPRFYDVGAGRVTIDGADLRDVTLASLRGQIALVSQEVGIFDDSARANIAYGKADCGEAEIIAAAKAAGAHDFISALPQGYDTVLGEKGVTLSGGERQRLSIARAMLKNASILLLDEATSALDSETERQVRAALDKLMRGRTSLVIAHRLSTVIDAAIIYVVDDGRIVEQGSHQELIAQGGLYARLAAQQFGDDAADAGAADNGVLVARA